MLKPTASNSFWLMGESVFGNGLSVLAALVVAHHYGPSDYGTLAYVFSMAAVLAVLGHAGLNGLLMRELVAHPDNQSETLGTVLMIKAAGYCIGAVLLVGWAHANPQHTKLETDLFAIAAFMLVLSPAFDLPANWFRARLEARYTASAKIAANVAGFGLKLSAVLLGLSVTVIGTINALTVAVSAILVCTLFAVRQGPPLSRWRLSLTLARQLIGECWLNFLGTVLALIALRVDQLMLRTMKGPDEVGHYALAATLIEATFFIGTALAISAFPALVRHNAQNAERYWAELQKLFDLLGFFGLCSTIAIWTFGIALVLWVMGPQYSASIAPLAILAVALPVVFTRNAFSRWIMVEKMSIYSVATQGAGAVSNVMLNLLLIPAHGAVGAAVATVISYGIAGWLSLTVFRRTLPLAGMTARALRAPWRGFSVARHVVFQRTHHEPES